MGCALYMCTVYEVKCLKRDETTLCVHLIQISSLPLPLHPPCFFLFPSIPLKDTLSPTGWSAGLKTAILGQVVGAFC